MTDDRSALGIAVPDTADQAGGVVQLVTKTLCTSAMSNASVCITAP
jgi:hypothetical protein